MTYLKEVLITNDNFADSVNAILANVKENGDKALFQYTKDFDKADINASNN